jgi:prepilin peptidase CpaA
MDAVTVQALAERLPEITLGLLVIATAAIDVRSQRIPNRLVWLGLALALATHAARSGIEGLANAGLGFAAGFAILLPMYLMRALGAGDVKLMAMVGAFLGPIGALSAALLTLLAGGVLALVFALQKGELRRLAINVRTMLFGALIDVVLTRTAVVRAPAESIGKLPYAVAIAAGTLAQLALQRAGRSLF